jgi:hypothetical protein
MPGSGLTISIHKNEIYAGIRITQFMVYISMKYYDGIRIHSSWYTRMIYYAEIQDYTGHGIQNYAGIRITQFNSTQA